MEVPLDVLLEIVARTDDAATVVRCAAASRHLRRGILAPSFAAFSTGLGSPFSFKSPRFELLVCNTFTGHVTTLPHSGCGKTLGIYRCAFLSIDVEGSFELVVMDANLWARIFSSEDGEWGPLRQVASPLDILTDEKGNGLTCTSQAAVVGYTIHWLCIRKVYPSSRPACRTDDGDPSSAFELLAAYWDGAAGLMIRIFTSKTGAWGAARAAVPCSGGAIQIAGRPSHANPAVVGRVAHWLCLGADDTPLGVIAVDADMAEVAAVDLPPDYDSGMRHFCRSEAHVLLVAVDGRLGLVVAESLAVSVWTLDTGGVAAASWSRQVVVGAPELERRAGLLEGDVSSLSPVEFLGFAEKSGAVVVLVTARLLVSLNLGTKAVATLWRGESKLGPSF
ncbi:unnamed protein product [Urochloa decumbens]|uniref:DUF7595 domain-containing protein n=1 Tax=Urochloa decumbens TaxID=240449 RepID=A0ABC8XPW2_9POAL